MQARVTDVRSKLENSDFDQRSATLQIVVLVMALLISNLRPPCQQPKKQAKETRFGDTVTQSANTAVLREVQQAKRPRKRKAYTAFTAEQRAAIGKYASEHGNAAAVKKFKADKNA